MKCQVKVVKKMGFGELLKINVVDLPYEILSWLVDKYDCRRKSIKCMGRKWSYWRLMLTES